MITQQKNMDKFQPQYRQCETAAKVHKNKKRKETIKI